jgi:hypothetical protein
LHQRGAAFYIKIFVVIRSETEGDLKKNDSAVWWKKVSRRLNICS